MKNNCDGFFAISSSPNVHSKSVYNIFEATKRVLHFKQFHCTEKYQGHNCHCYKRPHMQNLERYTVFKVTQKSHCIFIPHHTYAVNFNTIYSRNHDKIQAEDAVKGGWIITLNYVPYLCTFHS